MDYKKELEKIYNIHVQAMENTRSGKSSNTISGMQEWVIDFSGHLEKLNDDLVLRSNQLLSENAASKDEIMTEGKRLVGEFISTFKPKKSE